MARFSGKIQSAKFVDKSEKTIEVLYGDTPSKVSSWYLQVDYGNQDFLDLLEEINLETIQDSTLNFYERQKSQYEIEIRAKASVLAIELAEKMFNEWMDNVQGDIKNEYNKIDQYKQEQIRIAQNELDQQYKEVDVYRRGQLKILQDEFEEQIRERYKEVDLYKQEQMAIAQKELEEQYKQVEDYRRNQLKILQDEFEEQIKERYREADEYAIAQAKLLENEWSEKNKQVEIDYKLQEQKLAKTTEYLDYVTKMSAKLEEEKSKTEQEKAALAAEKAELLKKFKEGLNVPEQTMVNISGQEFIGLVFEKNNNEDFLFKSKITLFNREEIKNHPDRELKMKIRKAKDLVGLLAAYKEVIEYVNEESVV